jgi:hypothetical protein
MLPRSLVSLPDLEGTAKHPLTVSGFARSTTGASRSSRPSFGPPCPGERIRSFGVAPVIRGTSENDPAAAPFLAPQRGERWPGRSPGR